MRMLFCVIGTLVALFVTEASAQMVKAQTGWETSLAAKSENACYSCCRRWQTRMGWSPGQSRGMHTKVHDRDGPQLLTSFCRLWRSAADVRFRIARTCR